MVTNIILMDWYFMKRPFLNLRKTIQTKLKSKLWFESPAIQFSEHTFYFQAFETQSDDFSGRPTLEVFDQFMDAKGCVYSVGDFWKVQRKFGMSVFHGYTYSLSNFVIFFRNSKLLK